MPKNARRKRHTDRPDVTELESTGWEYAGTDGRGHSRYIHPTGRKVSVAKTVSDWRTVLNDRARIRRINSEIAATHRT